MFLEAKSMTPWLYSEMENPCVILEEAWEWGSGALGSGFGTAAALLAESVLAGVECLWARSIGPGTINSSSI